MNFVGGIYYRSGHNPENSLYTPSPEHRQHHTQAGPHTLFFAQHPETVASTGGTDLFLTADLVLYNIPELQQLLSSPGTAKEKLVLQAYQKWGKDCLQYIKGDFSGAIWDNQKEALFCFRDRLGNVPFYYYSDEDIFIFSNKIQFITGYHKATEINEDWIESFVTQSPTDNILTPYTHIKKLPPAHTFTINKTSASLNKYWHMGNALQQPAINVAEAVKH